MSRGGDGAEVGASDMRSERGGGVFGRLKCDGRCAAKMELYQIPRHRSHQRRLQACELTFSWSGMSLTLDVAGVELGSNKLSEESEHST
eukprot:767088-Hanusia_phi.AAC.2